MKLSLLHAFFGINYRVSATRESYHTHLCVKCGNVWSHSDKMRNNKQAHTCEKCGELLNDGWPQLTAEKLQEYIQKGIVKV